MKFGFKSAAAETFSSPEAVAAAKAVSPFGAGILVRQPFRGYELSQLLAGDDRRVVFRALDKNMERPVAVKVMHPWPGRGGAVEDFFSLAGSIARLRCPGVARGLDAGRGDGDFFLVYEWLAGESLAHKLVRRQSGRLTEKETLRLARDTAEILQNLFDRGHTHGRLTPGNIIIAEGGKPQLADIGFAWNLAWAEDREAFLAQPHYLPPELLAGEINIDVRGDLYCLGAICFQALLGRPVFPGDDPAEILRRRQAEKAPALGNLDPKIPVSAATSQLVRWLLETERDARPRTPKEFLRKLAAHPLMAEEEMEADPGEAVEGEPKDGVEILPG